ncbi:MAG: septal ring lytic transglycosylase RlpA family protein [Wenzhouxiangella sp.]
MKPVLRCAWLVVVLTVLVGCAAEVRQPTAPPQEESAGQSATRVEAPARRTAAAPRARAGGGAPSDNGSASAVEQFLVVSASSDAYASEGIASWYGRQFHGRPTASGEPFDMYQLTAAHPSLPLPTLAEVRNPENGQSVIVRINDRGPFDPERVIDLSWAAAVKLDLERAGIGPVEVRAISFDEPIQADPMAGHVPVLLEVGAFPERERANSLALALRNSGVTPVRTERSPSPTGSIWRVKVGPWNELQFSRRLAEQMARQVLGRPQFVYP